MSGTAGIAASRPAKSAVTAPDATMGLHDGCWTLKMSTRPYPAADAQLAQVLLRLKYEDLARDGIGLAEFPDDEFRCCNPVWIEFELVDELGDIETIATVCGGSPGALYQRSSPHGRIDDVDVAGDDAHDRVRDMRGDVVRNGARLPLGSTG